MKRILSGILAVIMIFAITGCTIDKSSVSFEEVQQMAEKEIPDISSMLGDNWDEHNLPESFYFLMVANARYLYKRDTGEELPTVDVAENEFQVNNGIELDILIPAITKYYPFSENMLRNSFEDSLVYDAQTDAAILADGWGWHLDAVVHNVTDNQDGTYDISYGLYLAEEHPEYIGVVKAKVHPDGYMQFISNTVDR
ncbi:MAG: hypothetical protein IJO59_01125 [Clostridia bacterium]|nr:hypothetical protein [Clostridia bacterium]